jgi:hypothetical protein
MFQKGHTISNHRDAQNPAKAIKTLTKQVEKHGKYLPAAKQAAKSRGRDLYLLYVEKNAALTTKQAIIAQCAHCMAWYADGRQDCECPDCPLYPYMPYGQYRKVRIQSKTVA